MKYQVPQFIEVEDKVFGPFTVRQFLYIAGAIAICIILYRFLGFTLAIVPMMAIGFLAGLLAFYKHNNRPFLDLLESAFYFTTRNRLYLWKKTYPKLNMSPENMPNTQIVKTQNQANKGFVVPKLSESKLKELTWSLDIKESVNPITSEGGQTNTR